MWSSKTATVLALAVTLLNAPLPCTDAQLSMGYPYMMYPFEMEQPSEEPSEVPSDIPTMIPTMIPTELDLGELIIWNERKKREIGPLPTTIQYCKSKKKNKRFNVEYRPPDNTTGVILSLYDEKGKRLKKNVVKKAPFMLRTKKRRKGVASLLKPGIYSVVATIRNHPTLKQEKLYATFKVIKKNC